MKSLPERSLLVLFSGEELFRLGIKGEPLTLRGRNGRLLLALIFRAAAQFAGLRRDGHYVAVCCRPLKNGGCRFFLQFTDQSCGRIFVFRNTDDLLDAVSQLRRRKKSDWPEIRIDHSGGKFQIYIPAGAGLSEGELALLNEYAE